MKNGQLSSAAEKGGFPAGFNGADKMLIVQTDGAAGQSQYTGVLQMRRGRVRMQRFCRRGLAESEYRAKQVWRLQSKDAGVFKGGTGKCC